MVRIWRFSHQKRCLKSDTRMTKSVTLDLPGDIIPGRDAARDLIRHLDQVLLFIVTRGAHARCSELGRISTAVTLYSGQFVAQSELSVVITLVPLTG